MPRGSRPGERRGGRAVGTPNAKTLQRQAIANIALAKGITPLEVMLANMRHFHKLAESAEAALAELSADKVAGMEPEDQFKYLLAEVKKATGLREAAQECARDAGPYIHPRLSSVESKVTLHDKRDATDWTRDELVALLHDAAKGSQGAAKANGRGHEPDQLH